MDEQFKEIEGLLEDAEPVEPRSFKKYAKLVLPHVALVAVVCLYAVIGAWIFYSLESPHEDRLKRNGVAKISEMRSALVSAMWERGKKGGKGASLEQWMADTDLHLQRFNEYLYKAFKEEYVRYPDVRMSRTFSEPHEVGDELSRLKRHRKSKARSEKGEKLWTASSALFFAATTMATIGYGNIVPITPYGRIACVVFALFGAPLAIITIGDLGKFLSECTIWLYKRMKKARNMIRYRFRKWRLHGAVAEVEEEVSSSSEHSALDWDDLVMDKTEVPVLLVFAILLLYIAFGGVLFALLESWTYMDAFYYCFVSLTTIGFGDLVPERHEYIVLMLIYLGVGLAVTTMCIDLVGIQYIQKIHYFGRKFRGTDLLHLLKRKRMIERRLAMGHGEEILQMYLHHLQEERSEQVILAEPMWVEVDEHKCALDYEADEEVPQWQVDDALVDSSFEYNYGMVEKVPTPTILSIRSVKRVSTPSLYSNSTASARSMMYQQRSQQRNDSWTESGPDISIHCSLSTSPSVHQREHLYSNYCSPPPSLMSFDFEFPIPSPDLQVIADYAKRSRRVRSCPTNINLPPPPLVSQTTSPVGLACMEEWDSYIKMLDDYCKPYVNANPPTPPAEPEPPDVVPMVASPPEIDIEVETLPEEEVVSIKATCVTHEASSPSTSTESVVEFPVGVNFTVESQDTETDDDSAFCATESDGDDGTMYHIGAGASKLPVFSAGSKPFDVRSALKNALDCPVKYISKAPPTMVTENYCFVVDGDVVGVEDINQGSERWWKGTGSTIRYYTSDEFKVFHQVNALLCRGEVRCAYKTKCGGGMEPIALEKIFMVQRFFSYWMTCSAFHRIISVVSPVTKEGETINGFRKRIFVQYLWRNEGEQDKSRVAKEYSVGLKEPSKWRSVEDSIYRKRVDSTPRLSVGRARTVRLSLEVSPSVSAFLCKHSDNKLSNFNK